MARFIRRTSHEAFQLISIVFNVFGTCELRRMKRAFGTYSGSQDVLIYINLVRGLEKQLLMFHFRVCYQFKSILNLLVSVFVLRYMNLECAFRLEFAKYAHAVSHSHYFMGLTHKK